MYKLSVMLQLLAKATDQLFYNDVSVATKNVNVIFSQKNYLHSMSHYNLYTYCL